MTQSLTAGSAGVTLDSVRTGLLTAIGSGRVGEPVNVRLHWQTGKSTTDLTETAIVAASLTDVILSLENPVWRVRTGAGGQLLHILARDDRGRTALISIGAGDRSTLAVTVYGNHGVVRLEDSSVSEQVLRESANEAWGANLKQAIQAASA
jgi:hypothetical protein